MNRIKEYFKNHPNATMQDYEDQRHRMHVIQAKEVLALGFRRTSFSGKHAGSKNKKKLLSIIKSIGN